MSELEGSGWSYNQRFDMYVCFAMAGLLAGEPDMGTSALSARAFAAADAVMRYRDVAEREPPEADSSLRTVRLMRDEPEE